MDMKMNIHYKSEKSIYQQIVDQIEGLILSGRIKADEFLSSVRETAVQNKINPNTIAKAYKELQRKGVVESVRGKGLRVCALDDKVKTETIHQILLDTAKKNHQICNRLGITIDQLINIIKETKE